MWEESSVTYSRARLQAMIVSAPESPPRTECANQIALPCYIFILNLNLTVSDLWKNISLIVEPARVLPWWKNAIIFLLSAQNLWNQVAAGIKLSCERQLRLAYGCFTSILD